MAKWFGRIGYARSAEIRPGVWRNQMTERKHYGDVIRNTRRLVEGERVNPNLTTDNSISLVADAYAIEHFFAIRYVEWAGALWSVSNVDVQSPRLILRLGEVYNGATLTPTDDTGGIIGE